MQKVSIIFSTVGFLVLLSGIVLAPCIAFWPPDRSLTMDNTLQWLSVYDEKSKNQSLAIELEFRGDATDFSILFATPSKPELREVDQKIFTELRSITPRPKPFPISPLSSTFGGAMVDEKAGVTIIEVKDVGDFTATVLTADSTKALTDWLDKNKYAYKPENVEAFDYYVHKPGFHFIALKINMKEASCLEKKDINSLQSLQFQSNPPLNDIEKKIIQDRLAGLVVSGCHIRGKLKPFEVQYTTDKPMLFTRIMGQNAIPMDITFYTIGKIPYYVPGTTVFYSGRLSRDDLKAAPSIKRFASYGDWITRATMKLDFDQIEKDITLLPGTNALSIGADDRPKIVNSQLVEKGNGVIAGHGYDELRFEQSPQAQLDEIGLLVFQASESLSGVTNSLAAFFPSIALFGQYPQLFAVFLFPIALGFMWPRKKAAKVTVVGTIVGAALTAFFGEILSTSGSSYYNHGYAFVWVIPAVVVSLLPATIFGVVAFLSSNYSRKIEFIKEKQDSFNNIPENFCYAFVGAIIVITVALSFSMSQLNKDVGSTIIISFLISLLAIHEIMKRKVKEFKPVKVELKKDDWSFAFWLFVAFFFLQFLLVGGLTSFVPIY